MHLYNDKKKLLFDFCVLSQSIQSHKNKAAPCNRLLMKLGLFLLSHFAKLLSQRSVWDPGTQLAPNYKILSMI